PGAYPGEVRLRGSRAVVARFTCFVDVPLDGAPETPASPVPAATRITRVPLPTGTAAPVPTPVSVVPTPSPIPVAPSPTPIPVTTPAPGRTAGPSPTPALTGSPISTSTVVQTATPGPTTTVIVTPIPNANSVRIIQVVLRNPALPNREVEYVEIRNATTRSIDITSWRLVNVNRSDVPPYVFPEFVISPAETINVYSAIDEDDPDVGEFFWKRTDVWRAGDRAELRDASDRLISFLVVNAS
ncbi:MAG: lamin tail domain-containing protein, partial [Chloroflexaceae bacterium]|nr:lamin tail domain-containing protein [Chloroflexaceae bacterium]